MQEIPNAESVYYSTPDCSSQLAAYNKAPQYELYVSPLFKVSLGAEKHEYLAVWLSCFASGFHRDEIPQQKAQQRDPYSTPPITIKRLNRTILMAARFVGMNSPYLCYRRSSVDSIIEERGICRHRFPASLTFQYGGPR
ncbi:hypothetical protein E4U12_000731 [Claviceps purpurea]|nr:hypothetical protein E4U12_000731 [Claviceps purpurea]KAG6180446.1 hypothetical protein E4U36_004842 [Claviceps purpurea]